MYRKEALKKLMKVPPNFFTKEESEEEKESWKLGIWEFQYIIGKMKEYSYLKCSYLGKMGNHGMP